MSSPTPDEQPTTMIPRQTIEQPAVSTAPATRRARAWHKRIPSRIGKARTSTVVIGCLFVVLFALNSALPGGATGTTPVTTSDGRVIQVPNSALPSEARSTPTPTVPATSTPAPASTRAPATTSSAPATTSRAPRSSAPTSTAPGDEESTTPAPSEERSTPAPTTSRAPATSRTPSPTDEEPTSAPTS
jgi:hypothetical protein